MSTCKKQARKVTPVMTRACLDESVLWIDSVSWTVGAYACNCADEAVFRENIFAGLRKRHHKTLQYSQKVEQAVAGHRVLSAVLTSSLSQPCMTTTAIP
eukprot:scaffold225418_cov17-Tisochrysis_lutea.AAC.3